MRSLVVVCSLLVAFAAALPTDLKKPASDVPSSPPTSVKTEVDTFHCSPNSNVALIKGKTLPIYVCRLGDISFVLAAEGHVQAHLDLALDSEAVKSLSDVYINRSKQRPLNREKRQFGGFGGGFSGSNANAGSFSSGGGFGHAPVSPFPVGGGFGSGYSQSGAQSQAGSFGGGFGFGR